MRTLIGAPVNPARNVAPALLRRDRVMVLGGLATVTAICWAYTLDMPAMPRTGPMSGAYLGWALMMWVVMMAAMMLPSAVPATLMYARFHRYGSSRREAGTAVSAFVGGYLAAWAVFSLAAALIQAGLTEAAVLSSMMMDVVSAPLGGALLIAAGLYQLTPAKQACLRHCRTPFAFMATQWREGVSGAFSMGLRHGAYCVGCCWALMALLFVAGVMNIAWIAAITAFVIVEKVAPLGGWVARGAGVALVAAGLWMSVG